MSRSFIFYFIFFFSPLPFLPVWCRTERVHRENAVARAEIETERECQNIVSRIRLNNKAITFLICIPCRLFVCLFFFLFFFNLNFCWRVRMSGSLYFRYEPVTPAHHDERSKCVYIVDPFRPFFYWKRIQPKILEGRANDWWIAVVILK